MSFVVLGKFVLRGIYMVIDIKFYCFGLIVKDFRFLKKVTLMILLDFTNLIALGFYCLPQGIMNTHFTRLLPLMLCSYVFLSKRLILEHLAYKTSIPAIFSALRCKLQIKMM